jgi:hypothetical protein
MALANRSSRSGGQSVVLLVLGMAVMRLRAQGCHIRTTDTQCRPNRADPLRCRRPNQ